MYSLYARAANLTCLAALSLLLAPQGAQVTSENLELRETAWAVLESSLTQGHPTVEGALLVTAVEKIPGRRSADLLGRLSRSPSPLLRSKLVHAWAHREDWTRDFFLETCASEESPTTGMPPAGAQWVEFKCAEAIARIDDPAFAIELAALLLEEGNPAVGNVVIQSLVQLGSPARPLLVRTLREGPSSVQELAAGALGRIGDAAGAEALQAAADNPALDRRVRTVAAWGLARLGDASAVSLLQQAVNEDDSILRFDAAAALCRLGRASYCGQLSDAFENPDRTTARNAASAAATVAHPSLLPVLRLAIKQRDLQSTAVQGLVEMATGSDVPLLEEIAQNGSPYAQSVAAKGLLRESNAGKTAVAALKRVLSSKEATAEPARGEAIEVLSLIDAEWAAELLRAAAVDDPSLQVRIAAVKALKGDTPPELLRAILEQEDQDPMMVEAVVDQLVRIGPTALPVLEPFMRQSHDATSISESSKRLYAAAGIVRILDR